MQYSLQEGHCRAVHSKGSTVEGSTINRKAIAVICTGLHLRVCSSGGQTSPCRPGALRMERERRARELQEHWGEGGLEVAMCLLEGGLEVVMCLLEGGLEVISDVFTVGKAGGSV